MNNIEVMNKDVAMNHVELCELINKLRVEEGNRKELERYDFYKKVKNEVETMKNLGLVSVGNFSESTYTNDRGREYPTFLMNRDGILY